MKDPCRVMSTTKNVLELKIELNKKVFHKQADKIKQKIDSLEQEYIALKASYNLIEYTLKSELSAVEHQLPPRTNLNLPKPVPATSGSTKPNAANIQKAKPIQVIDLTESVQEKKQNETPFPPIIPYYLKHKNRRKVNYSPIRKRRSIEKKLTNIPTISFTTDKSH